MNAPVTIQPDNGVMRVLKPVVTITTPTWRGLFDVLAFTRRTLDGCADLELERLIRERP